MLALIKLIFGFLSDLLRSRAALEAEILVLRQPIIVLRRGKLARLPFMATDKLLIGWFCRLFPNAREALAIVRPETVMRWHRAGFRSYWRWKSSRRSGRPVVLTEIRQLIREMSIANPLWGAPRIHGELLKLGIDIGQTSVAKYMARRRGPPSQGWKTFLRNHADGIAAMDLFVVPTVSFRLLYGLLIMGHGRRRILWLGVTAHPTAEWIANQLTQACGWDRPPSYLIRDRDACYGNVFIRRLRSIGIRDHPTSAQSPWQNGYAERLIGSIRREYLDHVVVIGERICVMCCRATWNITMRHAHICPSAMTRRSNAPFNQLGTSNADPLLVAYTTNMRGFDLRQGQPASQGLGKGFRLLEARYRRCEHENRRLIAAVGWLLTNFVIPIRGSPYDTSSGRIFAVAFQCASAFAQNYPSRPITMFVPFAAGGPADTLARFSAEPMRHSLNRPVIIEDRPGAAGTLGVEGN